MPDGATCWREPRQALPELLRAWPASPCCSGQPFTPPDSPVSSIPVKRRHRLTPLLAAGCWKQVARLQPATLPPGGWERERSSVAGSAVTPAREDRATRSRGALRPAIRSTASKAGDSWSLGVSETDGTRDQQRRGIASPNGTAGSAGSVLKVWEGKRKHNHAGRSRGEPFGGRGEPTKRRTRRRLPERETGSLLPPSVSISSGAGLMGESERIVMGNQRTMLVGSAVTRRASKEHPSRNQDDRPVTARNGGMGF